MKKITTLYLEETLKDKAKGLGLNLSSFLERKLRDYLRINDPEYARVVGVSHTNFLGVSVTLPSENRFSQVPAFVKHKRDYGKWLISRGLDEGYIKDLTNTLTRFISEDLTDIPDNISEMQVIALRNYLNYLVQKSLIDEQYANSLKKRLPLKQSNPDNFIPSDEMVREAFGKITEKRYQTIFKLLAFSGARITEIVRMHKEFDQSKLTVGDKFAKYQLHHNRGKKHSFFIYFPSSMVPELHKFYIHVDTITHQISKSGLSPKYLRKWLYNFLIYHNVPEGVADFIEGRSPLSVGSIRYLSKARQADHWYESSIQNLTDIFCPNVI